MFAGKTRIFCPAFSDRLSSPLATALPRVLIMASFAGKNDGDKLKALSQLKYKDQAVWFLNAFWAGDSGPQFGANEDEAERIWKFWEKAVEIDAKSEEGNELNEFDAHRLLEAFDSTLTVQKMREVLRALGSDIVAGEAASKGGTKVSAAADSLGAKAGERG